MPRIRTLKPEHKSHRKVGRLEDGPYRLWVGMLTETDDEGRLVAEAGQLRALVWPYHDISLEEVEKRILELDKLRLIRLYTVKATRYAVFPSFADHQRLDRPSPSKLPQPPRHILRECSSKAHRTIVEDSSNTREGSNRTESNRTESNRTEGDSTMAHAMGSSNGQGTATTGIKGHDDSPYNDCPEGRLKQACFKDGSMLCESHRLMKEGKPPLYLGPRRIAKP
jgi:hypothetical protein